MSTSSRKTSESDHEATKTEPVVLHYVNEGTEDIDWRVMAGAYTEQLNASFTLWLHLVVTTEDPVKPLEMLGKSCRFIFQRGALVRQVTGVVSEVQGVRVDPRKVTTKVLIVPAFEALRHRVDTRIFQDKTVPEILEAVLEDGLGAYDREVENRLERTYPKCEYRTQYNESDLAFCERLMEEEGIAYWFEFDDSENEKLILADTRQSFERVESYHDRFPSGEIHYTEFEGGSGGHEYIGRFSALSRLRPTKVTTRHFDWTRPNELYEEDSSKDEKASDDLHNGAFLEPAREVYQHDSIPPTFHEYDGLAFKANDTKDQIRLHREAQAMDARVAEGQSSVIGMTAGRTFELVDHPQSDLDREYLVSAVRHSFESSGSGYWNQFHCIPDTVPFRPGRKTPKPRIPNIQTATVVGPKEEEIHTDEHGRIMVQFHWDRQGKMDDHSSCWIRVMQPWAGAGWGFCFIPRIGMEVVVQFVNGDPDLPLVAGSVYNGEHPPPYELPKEKTKSTIKTRSSLDSDGFNELRFEDKKDKEEIFIHAQKDFNEVVEHDHYTLVHNDQTNEVDKIHTEKVHVDQHLIVDQDRTKKIKRNEKTNVDGTRTEKVKGDEKITLESNRTVKIESNDKLTIGAKRKQKVGKTYDLEVGDKITFKTGQSSITMKKDGSIEIKGVKIKVNGQALVDVDGGLITLN